MMRMQPPRPQEMMPADAAGPSAVAVSQRLTLRARVTLAAAP
jgi:hypothetical protein